VDGSHVEFGCAANLAANKVFLRQYKTAKKL